MKVQQPPTVMEAAKRIKLVAFDVDGVLTDGKITYTSAGEEIKSFNVRDGHAMKLASRAGLGLAIITGRQSSMVQRRCEELGVGLLFQGIKNKMDSLDEIVERTGLQRYEIAYMGDDVVDLPVMTAVGLSGCPSDADPEVCERSGLVTAATGGQGAAREFIFFILKAQGLFEGIMERYLRT